MISRSKSRTETTTLGFIPSRLLAGTGTTIGGQSSITLSDSSFNIALKWDGVSNWIISSYYNGSKTITGPSYLLINSSGSILCIDFKLHRLSQTILAKGKHNETSSNRSTHGFDCVTRVRRQRVHQQSSPMAACAAWGWREDNPVRLYDESWSCVNAETLSSRQAKKM